MAIVLGFNAKLYRNTATHSSPTWSELTNVRDCKLTLSADEVDVTTRAGLGYKQTEPGLIDANVEFGMVWDTTDAGFTAIQTAFLARSIIEVLVLDGAYTVPGSQGLQATMKVTKFDRDEAVAGVLGVTVTMKPCISANGPEWYTATT
jgi:hypothetical protein